MPGATDDKVGGLRLTTFYQLWCYYETEDVWKMEDPFDTAEGAQARVEELRGDVRTPCMPDWFIVKVMGYWK